MTTVLICGYYGFDNAGDDAVLYGIITSLHSIDPSIRIRIFSNQPAKTSALFALPAINRWSFAAIYSEIRKADLVILGGGTLLQDRTSLRSPLYYLGITKLAKLFRKPVFYYGQGFGPIVHTFSKWMIRWIVNRVDAITVRDDASGEEMRAYGVTKAPIHVTADPALTIDPQEANREHAHELLHSYGVDTAQKIAFVAIRDWKDEQRFKEELAQACDYLVEHGWQVVFLPMQHPSDVSPSFDTIQMMKQKAFLLDQPLNFKQILNLIGAGQLMIGMRLHALILAAILHVPFVSFSYDPKVDRFVESMGRKSIAPLKHLLYDDLRAEIVRVIADLPAQQMDLEHKVTPIIERAAAPATMVYHLLHKNNKEC